MGSTTVQAPAPPPAPTPIDPGKAALDYTQSMADPELQKTLLESERTYRPQYNELNLADYNTYLRGTGNQMGMIGLSELATRAQSQQNAGAQSFQRQADINDVANLGPQASAAFMAANPALANQLNTATAMGGAQNNYGALAGAIGSGVPGGNVAFNPAISTGAGAAPQVGSQGYQSQGYLPSTMGGVTPIQSKNVGAGYLGSSLYNQALNSSGYSQLGASLQGRGQELSQSRGKLTPQEYRQLDQSTRAGYAARGQEMGNASLGAEAFARLNNENARMMQDLGMAGQINQLGVNELGANRNFAQGVQGATTARQFGNVANDLAAQQANQGMQYQVGAQNQNALNQAGQFGASSFNQAGQFGATAANQAAFANQGMMAQYGLSNQAAANQYGLANLQASIDNQNNNRNFEMAQYQQNISNQGLLGQARQSQTAADRGYALQLAAFQQGVSSDPFMTILGRPSSAPGMGQAASQFASGLAGSQQGPQLFDPNAGINLALKDSANTANYNSAIFGAQAGLAGAQSQAKGAMIGGLMGGLGALGGGLAGGAGAAGSFGKLFG